MPNPFNTYGDAASDGGGFMLGAALFTAAVLTFSWVPDVWQSFKDFVHPATRVELAHEFPQTGNAVVGKLERTPGYDKDYSSEYQLSVVGDRTQEDGYKFKDIGKSASHTTSRTTTVSVVVELSPNGKVCRLSEPEIEIAGKEVIEIQPNGHQIKLYEYRFGSEVVDLTTNDPDLLRQYWDDGIKGYRHGTDRIWHPITSTYGQEPLVSEEPPSPALANRRWQGTTPIGMIINFPTKTQIGCMADDSTSFVPSTISPR